MGRKALPEGERRKAYTVRLLPEEGAFLEEKFGTVNDGVGSLVKAAMASPGSGTVVETPQLLPSVPVVVRSGVSPYSGKPLCPDCQRKGANIHCRACGANARGSK